MLVPFLNADGSVAAPGMSWANEQTSGWYRKAPNEFWYSVAGADVFAITAAGITLATGKIAEGISSFIIVQDAEPSPMLQGEQWYESDSGLLAMRYVNPDLTETLVSLAPAGGDFVPYGEKGAADGVAELDSSGQVPVSQVSGAISAHNADAAAHSAATAVKWQGAAKFVDAGAPTAGDGVDGDIWFQYE
jgi:hypothetical protein